MLQVRLPESETQIEIATELKYIHEENKKIILEKIDHESRMIVNLIKISCISGEIRDTK